MTVQFRLGHNDHKVIEDFISGSPEATSAITLDAKASRYHEHLAEVARDRGLSVFEPPRHVRRLIGLRAQRVAGL